MEIELINSGLYAFIQENYKSAADQFSKALEKDPNNIQALIYRAATYYKLGRYASGVDDLNKALSENKNVDFEYEILYNRAKLHISSNNFKAALDDLNRISTIAGLTDEKKANVDKLIKLIS